MSDQAEWIQVGALAEGFKEGSNILNYVDDLSGRTIDLYMENGWVIRHMFENGETLVWEIIEGDSVGDKVSERYTATCIREGVYFVDFVKSKEQATTVSLVINLNDENATAIIGVLPSQIETQRSAYQRVMDGDVLTPVATTIVQCSIGRPFSKGAGHPVTDELIGKRVQYSYSPHEYYEHIYLNENYYTWHCLKGVEKSLADTDLCHYFKVAEDLYLFIWRERVIPTLGVIMVDLKALKTTGKIVGYDGDDFDKLNNFSVGAYAKVLNETAYEVA